MSKENYRFQTKIEWSDEDDAWIATSPLFPCLSGMADNENEALAILKDAISDGIEMLKEKGLEIPKPQSTANATHSGNLRIRIPRSLHSDLANEAEINDSSLNTYIVHVLSSRNHRHEINPRQGGEKAGRERVLALL